MSNTEYPATTYQFKVTVDGVDIGSFTACEGLSAEYDVTTHAEGGENGYEHRLPGRLRYSTIRLSRPVDPRASGGSIQGGLASWFSDLKTTDGRTRACKTAAITAYDPNGVAIASWNLVDAYPFRWQGPSMTAAGHLVAEETLELVHHGFIQ